VWTENKTNRANELAFLHQMYHWKGQTGVSWALLVYMQNCQPKLLVLIDRKVKLVYLFKTMELLNNRYAFYTLGMGRGAPHPYRLTHFAL